MSMNAYATYRADRFGKVLTIREPERPEPIASIPFDRSERVTFGLLAAAVQERGYSVSGTWRPSRSTLKAVLARV
jgi:hypothetical protein